MSRDARVIPAGNMWRVEAEVPGGSLIEHYSTEEEAQARAEELMDMS